MRCDVSMTCESIYLGTVAVSTSAGIGATSCKQDSCARLLPSAFPEASQMHAWSEETQMATQQVALRSTQISTPHLQWHRSLGRPENPPDVVLMSEEASMPVFCGIGVSPDANAKKWWH